MRAHCKRNISPQHCDVRLERCACETRSQACYTSIVLLAPAPVDSAAAQVRAAPQPTHMLVFSGSASLQFHARCSSLQPWCPVVEWNLRAASVTLVHPHTRRRHPLVCYELRVCKIHMIQPHRQPSEVATVVVLTDARNSEKSGATSCCCVHTRRTITIAGALSGKYIRRKLKIVCGPGGDVSGAARRQHGSAAARPPSLTFMICTACHGA